MKKFLLPVAIVILVLIGYTYFKSYKSISTKRIPVEITVDKGISDKADIIEGTTALDYLKSRAKVETKGEGVNAYIVSISGRKADESKREYWAFYINGKLSEVGAGSYILKNGDKIEWKIANY